MVGKQQEEDLARSLASLKSLGVTGTSERNQSIAKNVLDEEMDKFGDSWQSSYALSQAVGDRLLVHGRQDGAHALLNSISILREVEALRSQVRTLNWLSVMMLIVIAALAYKLL